MPLSHSSLLEAKHKPLLLPFISQKFGCLDAKWASNLVENNLLLDEVNNRHELETYGTYKSASTCSTVDECALQITA